MGKIATRERIVTMADDLFYQQGFEHTSFTDIAKVLNISRGNFYHHFKTKDQILHAVIEHRLSKTQEMLNNWEQQSETPEQRIKCYIRIVVTNWAKIKLYGCPVGTLSNELAKLDHTYRAEAKKIFTLFRNWLKMQFLHLSDNIDADKSAMHVLAWSQGVATMANAFQNKEFVLKEVDRMCSWVDSLSVKLKS